MASQPIKAIALSLAMTLAPLAASPALAGGAVLLAEPTVGDLTKAVTDAVAAAKADPTYAGKSPAQKLAAIQVAVSAALAESGGGSDADVASALDAAVQAGTIPATLAVQVAAAVSPALMTMVTQSSAVKTQLAAQGVTVGNVTTASTAQIANGAPSVLVSLAYTASTGGTSVGVGTSSANTGTNNPATYDPCAGVIATYCGI